MFSEALFAQQIFLCNEEGYPRPHLGLDAESMNSFSGLFSEIDALVGVDGFLNEANVLRTFYAGGYEAKDLSDSGDLTGFDFDRECGDSTVSVRITYCKSNLLTFELQARILTRSDNDAFRLSQSAFNLSKDAIVVENEVYRWTLRDGSFPAEWSSRLDAQRPNLLQLASSYQYTVRDLGDIAFGIRRQVGIEQNRVELLYRVEGTVNEAAEREENRSSAVCEVVR